MRYPVETLTSAEVNELLRQCSRSCPTGLRNRALIALMYRGGLRVSECLALYPRDLDVKTSVVNVRHGKGDKQRLVGLDAGALALVEAWLEERTGLGLNGKHPLLCTLDGKPLYTSYVRTLMKRLGEKAGVEKRVHAHGLRHTHASELCREGVPLNVIQAQLGHTSLATTDRYLRHVAPQDVVNTMRAREWSS